MGGDGRPFFVRKAEQAREVVAVDPARARAEALAVLDATEAGDEARAVALRVLAVESRLRGDAHTAERLLHEAIAAAERAGSAHREAQARLSLVMVLADQGHLDDALTEAASAESGLRGAELGYLLTHRAVLLNRAAQYPEAVRVFDRALRLVGRSGEPEWRCRVLSNRGISHTYLGDYAAAQRDLRRTHEIALEHGLDLFAGRAQHNLGFVALVTGDVPGALRAFTDAERWLPPAGHDQAARLLDLADAYLTGRLFHEARETLERAVAALDDGGFAVDVAEAQLLLARAHLLDDDPDAAATVAAEAVEKFRRQRRPGWTALAEHTTLSARVGRGECNQALLRELRRSARRLDDRGWAHAAVHSRVLAGDMARRLGNLRLARSELTEASRARQHGPIAVRAPAWYATAARRLVDGDERGALRAARSGLHAVDEFAATLGATDLRVRASGWGADLASFGIRLTRESGDPWRYLTWVERWRANALRLPPVRPPHDPQLAHDLVRLRRVTSDLASASAAGEDTRALAAEQLRLERTVRDRSRLVEGPARQPIDAPLDRAALREQLGERALVELTDYDGELVACTLVDGRCRMHELGPVEAVTDELASLRFSLHRLARRHGSAASLAAAEAGVEHSARQLDALLLRPIARLLGDRELVLAPTGALHALPWSVLPTLRGRPVTVTPSATLWLAARQPSRRRSGGTTAVAGPGLEHAQAEVRSVVRHHHDAHRLTGRRATVAATLDALDGADVAHIAAHGTFRSDNPQFSALDLADGPLTVYDLERLTHAPYRLVLSACDTALSAVHAGDELQGVAAAFFALGTRTLVASVTPVDDEETRALMARFHRELAGGTPPGRALADAGATTGALGFVCFGTGE